MGELLLHGQDMAARCTAAHQAGWGLGTAQRWGLEQTTGVISWLFPDKTVTAPAQILGSHAQGSWRWAWANASVLPHMAVAAESVKSWGQEHNLLAFTSPTLAIDIDAARDLVAIAFRVTEATGLYAPTSSVTTFITFGDCTIGKADGTTTPFHISLDG